MSFWRIRHNKDALYYAISYHTIPYHTIPYHTIPYHTILYHTILYYTILYYTIPYHTIPYHTIPYHTIPYYTILYYTTSKISSNVTTKTAFLLVRKFLYLIIGQQWINLSYVELINQQTAKK